jgi:hypothetical protein
MITQAIINLRPGARFILVGDDYSGLEWLDTVQSKPTLEEVTAEIANIQASILNNQYKINRAAEYPSIGDQLDALFHAGVFPADMAARIQAVKDQYPKP